MQNKLIPLLVVCVLVTVVFSFGLVCTLDQAERESVVSKFDFVKGSKPSELNTSGESQARLTIFNIISNYLPFKQ